MPALRKGWQVHSNEGARILVVEDDPEQRELLLELLGGAGHACDGASGVASAAALLAAREYALVLVDYDLRDGTGAELVALGVVQASRVVYLSGRAPAELPHVAAALRKPLDGGALLARLERLLPRGAQPRVELVLYVASGSPASQRAERAIRSLLAGGAFGAVSLEVIDLGVRGAAVLGDDRAWLTPTLVRRAPLPQRWLVGDGVDAAELAALVAPSASRPPAELHAQRGDAP